MDGIRARAGWHARGLFLVLLLPPALFGLDSNRSMDQFFHTAWTIHEGAPSGITELAQTADGFLWLATQSGLFRFDGVRFERYEPSNGKFPSTTVSAVLALPEGGLWIGFVPHGAAFVKDGRMVTYEQSEGLPLAPIFAFGRDVQGTVWAGTSRGLWRFNGSKWQTIGPEWHFPDVSVDGFFLDREGRFWVSTLNGLFCLPPHGRAFVESGGVSVRLSETRDGTVWKAARDEPIRAFSQRGEPFQLPLGSPISLEADRLLIDRDNTLWILTSSEGIARVSNPDEPSPPARLQRFTQEDGLSDNRITDVLEDREGDIWVATRGGLDRFRPRNVVPGPFPYGPGGQDLALVADQEGAVWAGNLGQPLMRFDGTRVSLPGGPRSISCAYRDPEGTLWFGGEGLLTRLVHGRLENVSFPKEIDPRPYWTVQAITSDPAGGFWVSITQNGVFRLRAGVWSPWGGVAALPQRTAVVLWTDPEDRVWFGYTENEVAVLQGDRVRTYSSADGLDLGTVTAIGESHGHILAGGQFGLALFDGRRFQMLSAGPDNEELRGVSGIVETAAGDLWLNGANGLSRIASRDLETAFSDIQRPLRFEKFDFRDGVPGTASPVRPLPSAILANDGRIWVSGTSGAAWIDPARIHRNPLPPPVSIEAIYADDKLYSTGAARLPVLPSNVRIEYTALSLQVPERVRFRYWLEGFDQGWQDAGTRRAAFYTKLGPGRYRFHVIACNNDGVWNDTGATAELNVPPAYYQTAWFAILCAGAGMGILWTLYVFRLRQVGTQLQARIGERLGERERIARELHDTLLQGMQGALLRFGAAAKQIPDGLPARRALEEALDVADQVMVEGRDRVRDLRAHAEAINALPEAFSAAGEELLRDHSGTAFRVKVDGTPRELHPLVRDEAYRIGREALVNAFTHAGARDIEVQVAFTRRELNVRFRDNGRGIDEDVLDAGGKPGHWGLAGMRERAAKMGAQVTIRSRPGAGTEVALRIPAGVAYRERQNGGRFSPGALRARPRENE